MQRRKVITGGKNCEKRENEGKMEPSASSITHINAFKEDRLEGEGALI